MQRQINCLGILLLCLYYQVSIAQSVSINDDASLPHSSAILDIKVAGATKKGVLLPRMTTPQRTAITTPAKGLLVYDSTNNSFWFHNGTSWQEIAKGANAWTVSGTNVYNLKSNIGIGTSNPKAKLNVAKGQMVLFGESLTGLGRKMYWNGIKGAFRAGAIEADYPNDQPPFPWDDSRVGDNSFATGADTEASGFGSAAFGSATKATNYWSMAGGTWSEASGRNSFAFGFSSSAAGDNSIAVGYVASARKDYSVAFGRLNTSYGVASITAGAGNETYGSSSATFGASNFNTSNFSLVIGQSNDSITSQTQASAGIAPLFTVGNGSSGIRKNALVVLRNGNTGINKNPGSVAVNDGLLQLKQAGTRHLLTLEAAANSNKWSFTLTPNLVLYYNNAIRGTFNATTGAYVAGSDIRLKKDMHSMEPVLENIMQLKMYTYHLLDNEPTDQLSYGLMAHELQEVFPDLVSKLDPQDKQSLLGINYSNLSVLSIKSIQELKAIIDIQHSVIEKLTDEFHRMEVKLEAQELRLKELENRSGRKNKD